MKKALPIVILSTLSAAVVAALVVVSAKSPRENLTDEPDSMYQKYGRDYAVLETMETEYDRLLNKKFLSEDEKLLRDSLPVDIIQYKKKIGMELTQDEIDYMNSLEMAEPIEN